ncbi:MAG: GNAT family N-acetyltransferase [Anaerolineales bacterium]|nr:GNAT family N-acetyltransferase [Anaerolineales bacterium]
MTESTLHTKRLLLRPLTLTDVPALFELYRDPETMRFMTSLPHQSAAETHAELERGLTRQGAFYWAICLRESGEVIGLVNYLGETTVPGMGYALRRDFWGRGLMTEAARAAVAYGFEQVGYNRIELWIDQNNFASQRVAQKLNFRLKGRIPLKYTHQEEHHMMLVYGLWAYEWHHESPPKRPPSLFSAQPVLMVEDVVKTAVFYRDKLDFQIDFLYGEPPHHGAVSCGDWTSGGVTIQLTQAAAEQRPLNPASYLYIFVGTAIDQLYEKYRANGVTIVHEPTSYPWGMREFTVQDLNGYSLRFGTHQ